MQREPDGKGVWEVVDEYSVEIDQLHDDTVALVVPAMRLVVFGRTMDEALAQARASIRFRVRDTGRRPEPAIVFVERQLVASRSGLTAA